MFLVSPRKDLFFKGVVVNSNISNINGEELLLIFILKNKKNIYVRRKKMKGKHAKSLAVPKRMQTRDLDEEKGIFIIPEKILKSLQR